MSTTTRVAAEKAIIASLEKEEAADLKETEKALKAWEKHKEGSVKGSPSAVKVFGGLTVSWTEDGKEYQIGPEVDLNPAFFRQALASIPQVVRAHIARRHRPTGPRPKSPRELSKDYERRRQERATKRFHAEERLRDLERTE